MGWLYSIAGMYAFDELFCFGDVDCTLLDVNVVHDKRWFHDVFKDTWCKSLEEEGDCLSVAYGIVSLPG